MRRWIALAMTLAGCSQLLGLDKPAPLDAATDRDNDTIPDAMDNCPDVANPFQDDRDVDGIGDACDECAAAALRPTDDEDGDGKTDTVDNCVGIAGVQTDDDNDGVGNICDPRTGADHTACVFTFRTPAVGEPMFLVESTWSLGSWEAKNGTLVTAATETENRASYSTRFDTGSAGMAVEARGHVNNFTNVSIGVTASSVDDTIACRVNVDAAITIELRTGTSSMVVNLTTPPTSGVMRLVFEPMGSTTKATCSLVGVAAAKVSDTLPWQLTALSPGVTATSADAVIDDVVVYRLGD